MIPFTIHYDEFIDRPKLTEQKKPFEYIVTPSTLKWGSKQMGHLYNFGALSRKHLAGLKSTQLTSRIKLI